MNSESQLYFTEPNVHSNIYDEQNPAVRMTILVQPADVQVKRVGRASCIDPDVKLSVESTSLFPTTININAYLKVLGKESKHKLILLRKSDDITFSKTHKKEIICMKLRFLKTIKVQVLKRNLGVSRPEASIVFEAVNKQNEVEGTVSTTHFVIISDPRYLDEVKKRRATERMDGYISPDSDGGYEPRPSKRLTKKRRICSDTKPIFDKEQTSLNSLSPPIFDYEPTSLKLAPLRSSLNNLLPPINNLPHASSLYPLPPNAMLLPSPAAINNAVLLPSGLYQQQLQQQQLQQQQLQQQQTEQKQQVQIKEEQQQQPEQKQSTLGTSQSGLQALKYCAEDELQFANSQEEEDTLTQYVEGLKYTPGGYYYGPVKAEESYHMD